MFDKKKSDRLLEILSKYNKLDAKVKKSAVIADLDLYTQTKREIKKIEKISLLIDKWKKCQKHLEEWIHINQEEVNLKTLATKEINNLKKEIINLENNIEKTEEQETLEKIKHNTIIEIRSAAGGREASIFAEELSNMYFNLCKRKKWKYEVWEKNFNEGEGLNLIIFYIKNKDAYPLLQHEGGVHRVQRIPKTETNGKTQTSAATVAILEEINEKDMPLNDKDLRIDTFRSSGAGGQHVNTTDSGVRVTHLPSGLSVACQEGRSQHDNKDKAKKLLRSRLSQIQEKTNNQKIISKRNQQIGEGDRSEKIRTYNFLQNRVTDHRINFSEKNINEIMNGKLDKILNQLMVLNDTKK